MFRKGNLTANLKKKPYSFMIFVRTDEKIVNKLVYLFVLDWDGLMQVVYESKTLGV